MTPPMAPKIEGYGESERAREQARDRQVARPAAAQVRKATRTRRTRTAMTSQSGTLSPAAYQKAAHTVQTDQEDRSSSDARRSGGTMTVGSWMRSLGVRQPERLMPPARSREQRMRARRRRRA